MAGDTITSTPPTPWVCPTPDLDLRDVEWSAHEVKSGTPYHDEPSEMIDPGWYVHGFLPDHDPRDAPPITIKIEGAYDEHGCDRGERLARRLVEVLSLAEPGDRYEVDISKRWRFLPLAHCVTVTDRLTSRVLLDRTGIGYSRMLSAGLAEADGQRWVDDVSAAVPRLRAALADNPAFAPRESDGGR